MLRLYTECYVKRAHPQCVDVAIFKIILVGDVRPETDVRSASGGVDARDRHEVLREPSVGVIRSLLQYRVKFSTAFVPYGLWATWFNVCRYTSCLTETLLQSPKHMNDWITSVRIA
jgi:hypothetical protein